MNNLVLKIKMFLKNKNTVTMLGALLIVAVLYFGYQMNINNAVKPIKVPYAKVDIQPKQKITKDMIGYMTVAKAGLKGKVILDESKLVGYYTKVNTIIPEGSMFYESAITTKDDLPDSALYDVPKGETLYYLPVNMTTTYSNSMLPGNYIDIYIQTMSSDVDGNMKVMVGKLVGKIKILAVKTSNGLNVFENSDESRIPATIIFSVKEDIHLLLRKAATIGNLNNEYRIDIIPVPNAEQFKGSTEQPITQVTNEYLKNFIEEKSIYIPEDQILENGDSEDTTNDVPSSKEEKSDTSTKDDEEEKQKGVE